MRVAETDVSENWIVPFSLARGNDGLQRRKRGAIAERDESASLHGAHGAYEAVDDDMAGVLLRFPIQEFRDRLGSSTTAIIGSVATRQKLGAH